MSVYIVAGILLIGIFSFATWGYLQQYRDLRHRILEDRETEALVHRLVYGDDAYNSVSDPVKPEPPQRYWRLQNERMER